MGIKKDPKTNPVAVDRAESRDWLFPLRAIQSRSPNLPYLTVQSTIVDF